MLTGGIGFKLRSQIDLFVVLSYFSKIGSDQNQSQCKRKAMKIRDATESDLAAMYAIDHVAAEEETRKQHIREWVDARQAIVALIDDVVVGYAALEYTFFSVGFISVLMVGSTSRRQGIATALVWHLERGCETNKLFTSTNESNKPMRELMQNLSYEPSGTVYNLDEGDPELFYFKRL